MRCGFFRHGQTADQTEILSFDDADSPVDSAWRESAAFALHFRLQSKDRINALEKRGFFPGSDQLGALSYSSAAV